MSKYEINFKSLIGGLLPLSLRGTCKRLVQFLINGLQMLHANEFEPDRVEQLKEVDRYDCRYPHLQKMLNDKLDDTDRRIRVNDTTGDLRTVLVYPNGSDYRQLVVDNHSDDIVVTYPHRLWEYLGFTVWVPDDWEENDDNWNRAVGLVERFKPAGTKYQIVKQ